MQVAAAALQTFGVTEVSQSLLLQSVLALHFNPSAQAGQVPPPQSTSVSRPFIFLSVQVGAAWSTATSVTIFWSGVMSATIFWSGVPSGVTTFLSGVTSGTTFWSGVASGPPSFLPASAPLSFVSPPSWRESTSSSAEQPMENMAAAATRVDRVNIRFKLMRFMAASVRI